ncbi:GNAT family N-acetyltransferase [Inquilinus sp. KBS0705]|nr:GNAT family N-acetyltransferase [Inquilinus sp. KBS0705]
MKHVLDNPIYNALVTANARFANGNDRAVYYTTDVAPFAGLKENTAEDFAELDQICPAGSVRVIFTPEEVVIPVSWKLMREMDLLQMVYEGERLTTIGEGLVDLEEQHIPAMIALTQLTNPGPFLQRTIDFGNYTGIFADGELVAMAGQRQQPSPYVEVSAVCTHPNHLGKGYASILLREQVRRIMAVAGIPFLHVLAGNQGAIKVYERLGFKTRRAMKGYVLQK